MSFDIKKLAEDNTIFLSVIGSHAYGTNLPTSDEDMGGVCIIPDKAYYIGTKNFEQADSWTNEKGEKIDKTIYSIRKIVGLCLDNNPNCLDLLFVPERCKRIIKPQWQKFIDVREDFLCSRLRFSLSGYAHSQIHRIKNHRQYLLNPPERKPERKDFGLPEVSMFPITQIEAIARISTDFVKEEDRKTFHNEAVDIINKEFYLLYLKYMDREMANMATHDFQKDQINWLNLLCSIQSVFLKEEWLDAAQRELKFIHAKREYDAYVGWNKSRNEKRKALEAKCGYDAKFAAHAIRLLRMGKEYLETGKYEIDRTNIDAPEIIDIRLGNQPFENIMSMADKLLEEVEALYKTTTVPKHPKREKIEGMLMETIDEYVWGKK
jgi:predicted nucleotidyltransferase